MSSGKTCLSPVRRIAGHAVCSGLMVTLAPGLSGCGPPYSFNPLGLLFALPAILSGPECDELLGPCPPPEPSVLLNNANISRSIWFEEARIGASDDRDLIRSLCQADLDGRPGDELVFRGHEGLTVLAAEAGLPFTIAFVPAERSWNVMFLDVDGDGDTEFLFQSQGELWLWDHDGNLLWRQSYSHTTGIPLLVTVGWGDWEHADINGDGIEEFAITAFQGVDIIAADGSVIDSLSTGSVRTIRFGDVTGDGALDIVTQTVSGVITIWEAGGDEISTLDPSETSIPASAPRLRLIRLPDSDRDQILLDCAVYDIDGSVVTRLDTDESWPGYCPVEEVEYGRAAIESQSCMVEIFGFFDEPVEHEIPVQFAVKQEPFLVHLSYSIDSEPPPLAGLFSYQSTRTILRIFNAEGTLVYHEVLESVSTPGSAAVIPSDVPGEELLLLADGTRILAYFLGENSEE